MEHLCIPRKIVTASDCILSDYFNQYMSISKFEIIIKNNPPENFIYVWYTMPIDIGDKGPHWDGEIPKKIQTILLQQYNIKFGKDLSWTESGMQASDYCYLIAGVW